MAVGRISGPLLKANLLRDGVDLAFETDLLYLDVINGRIGVKTSSPAYDLDINGTTRTTNLIVNTEQVGPGTFTISGNTIASSNSTISLEPASPNAVVYQGKLVVDDIQMSTNTIEITTTDTDLAFNTLGTGKVNVNSNMLVNGDLHATGTITADGNIIIGDADTDGITFNADITSNIIPDQTNTYDLGSDPGTGGKAWKTAYIDAVNATALTATSITANGIDLVLPQGNIIYVAKNGLDTNAGLHEHNSVLTIKHALTLATSGDTVYIYAGVYDEIFPLTIPVGVTVKGAGVRATTIQPTSGTITQDAFLLNGETTVEDLTIQGFRFASGTGYAFRFASGFTVTSRSPYIRNITVITRGSTVSGSDPYGFDSNDAGKGVLADGSVADASSKEAAMLFHSVTFFTPNQETIIATNGVRIEWLNSFAYFAEKGIYAYSSATGFAGAGLTRLRINTQTGTWNVGNTLTYYDTDGTTVLATGTIASKTGDFINLTGRVLGFETITDRVGKLVYPQGDAKLSTAQKKFGASSLVLDGTGDYITVSSTPDFDFGTGDFTLEGWIYVNSITATNILFDFRTTDTQAAPAVGFLADGSLFYYVNGASVIAGSAGNITTSTWHHVAVAKASGNTKLYVNGNQVGSTYTDAVTYIQSPITIGAAFITTAGFVNGYIDDVRVSKGIARYTGATYTVPTAALAGDLNTVLLLHFNGNNNSTTILDDGVTLQDLRTSGGGTATIINFADYSDFGAEIRSIGSANVYGTYGVYGDGVGVIAYLISENFAYVGAGKLTTNDPNDRIAANEVVELNGARIYYTSVDNEGNFKVGDNFYVNQKTGEVLFNGQTTTITSLTGVTFTDGVNSTIITSTDLTTGNIKISGNTIESLTGDVNITAASGSINLQNNTYVTGNLDVTGDVTIGGNIQIGDAGTDTVNFVAGINSNLVPATTASYDLGTTLLRWNNAFLSRVEIDGLVIDNNTISTTIGNDNLQLIANGTGKVYIPSNDVQLDQALSVTGTTTLHDTDITGTLTQTGDVIQTGNYTQIGDTIITGNLTVSTFAQFENIRIDTNTISTTLTNTDLQLEAAGTGKIYVPLDDVLFNQNLTVNGVATIGTLDVTGTVQANLFSTGDINIDDNFITTTVTNQDLELRANGTGEILIPSNNVQINNNLTVTQDLTVTTGITYLKSVSVIGDITQTGNINQTGNITTSGDIDATGYINSVGYLQLPQVRIENNVVSTTVTNTDLQLQANGAGNVVIEGIKISDNNIQSVVTNSNITLTPQGTGNVIISSNQSIQIPVGDTASRPDPASNGMIRYNTDLQRYEGYNGSYWLTLSGVADADGNTKILAELTPGANDNILYFYADGNLTATIDATKLFTQRLQTSNLDLNGNTISSITTNTDLNLTATGTGSVRVGNLQIRNNTITNISSGAITEFVETGTGYVKIAGTNGVVIPAGDGYLDRPLVPETGMMRFNTDAQLVEVYNGVTWGSVAGASGGVTTLEASDIGISSALIFG